MFQKNFDLRKIYQILESEKFLVSIRKNLTGYKVYFIDFFFILKLAELPSIARAPEINDP